MDLQRIFKIAVFGCLFLLMCAFVSFAQEGAAGEYQIPINQLQGYPQIQPEQPCDGCKIEDRCVPYGAKFTVLTQAGNNVVEVPVVCTYGGISPLKPQGAYCNYNYECESNMCVKNTCVTLWGLIKYWFAKIFSFLFPRK